jgi:phage shock protein PspC (stress-responsive transcriptional regulator)
VRIAILEQEMDQIVRVLWAIVAFFGTVAGTVAAAVIVSWLAG